MNEADRWVSLPGGGAAMRPSMPDGTPDAADGAPRVPWDDKVKVLLVDDQPLYRDVARAMLEQDGRFEVVGEASDGARAVEKVVECSPDIVLMDVSMPVMTGIEATRRIRARHPDQNIVLTSINEESAFSDMAEKAGALAFIAKRNLSTSALHGVLGTDPPSSTLPMSA